MLVLGDCREVLREIADNTFDSCVCDPPYEIGILGHSWDKTGIAYDQEVWSEVLRVLKPGGYCLAFSFSRTYHRVACAIEDSGFEIRDQIDWVYGEGMNKGGKLGPKIDKALGAEREVVGTRVLSGSAAMSTKERGGTHSVGLDSRGRKKVVPITAPSSDLAKLYEDWGVTLKPAIEPIVVARKPFEGSLTKNVIEHGVGGFNFGACRVPVKGEIVNGAPPAGRVPPNLLLGHAPQCSREECVPWCPVWIIGAQSGVRPSAGNKSSTTGKGAFWGSTGRREWSPAEVSKGDTGTAARYFPQFLYSQKASPREKTIGDRIECIVPSVKPLKLIRWLTMLVTPPGGWIVDPFAGSCTGGIVAAALGMRWYGIELKEEHYDFGKKRIKLAKRHLLAKAA